MSAPPRWGRCPDCRFPISADGFCQCDGPEVRALVRRIDAFWDTHAVKCADLRYGGRIYADQDGVPCPVCGSTDSLDVYPGGVGWCPSECDAKWCACGAVEPS